MESALHDQDGIVLPDGEWCLPNGTARPDAYDMDEWVQQLHEWQVTATRQLVGGFEDGAKAMYLDAAVGAGKTLIGSLTFEELIVGGLLPVDARAGYLCSDKQLQRQFAGDFSRARMLMGRANYPTLEGGRSVTTDDCTSTGPEDPCQWCDPKHKCPFQMAKRAALRARYACLNMSMFLAMANYTPDFRTNRFVIIDEADKVEESLLNFIEFEVPAWIGHATEMDYPKKGVHKTTLVTWLDEIQHRASKLLFENAETFEVKQLKRLDSFAEQARMVAVRMRQDIDKSDKEDTGRWIRSYGTETLKLLPAMVDQFGPGALWRYSDRWMMMSGTIISADQRAADTGMPLDYGMVHVPSPYPPENRQFVVVPVCNNTRNMTDEDFLNLVFAIERIAEEEEGRVLVHTVSYAMTRRIVDAVNFGRRPVTYYLNAGEKQDQIRRFEQTPSAIMFAPSMDRGWDGKGELCTAQMITKCPFPYLGDQRIGARMKLEGGQPWYATQTVAAIVQMHGRGVRTPTDVCTTYMLDKQFSSNVWRHNSHLFPQDFHDVINNSADIRRWCRWLQ